MGWLLKFLVLGHIHKWETLSHDPLTLTEQGRPIDRGVRYVLRCKCCGDVTKRDLI